MVHGRRCSLNARNARSAAFFLPSNAPFRFRSAPLRSLTAFSCKFARAVAQDLFPFPPRKSPVGILHAARRAINRGAERTLSKATPATVQIRRGRFRGLLARAPRALRGRPSYSSLLCKFRWILAVDGGEGTGSAGDQVVRGLWINRGTSCKWRIGFGKCECAKGF